jgi:flagellin-like hook-associated protein FlgL
VSRNLTLDVIDAGQVPSDNVTLRAYWTDEDGQPHTKDLTFSKSGASGCLALPVYGDTPLINLTGDTATATAGNTGTGVINMTGTYTGFQPRTISFTVADAGQLDGDGVKLTASWTDDDGHSHSEDVTLTANGSSGAVEIPNSDGVKVYLDTGTFVAGETYTYDLALSPHHGGDAIYVNLDNGNFKVGDSFHSNINKTSVGVLDTLKEWNYRLANDDQEKAQTQSQQTLVALNLAMQTILDYIADSGARQDRVTVRQGVMDDQIIYHGQNLEDLQDVDMTQAFLDLRAQQTSYTASLKVISVMSQLSLLNYL